MRTVLHTLLWASFLGGLSTVSIAQAQPVEAATATEPSAEVDALESRSMAIVTSGEPAIGSRILGSSRMMAGRASEMAMLDGQIAAALPIYGRALGWERIGERRIGSYVVHRRYIVQHENMLTVWYLVYIKMPRGWEVAGVNFNDQLQTLDNDW